MFSDRTLKGTYTIILQLRRSLHIAVKSLHGCDLQPNFYAYTGSALGKGSSSIVGRLGRHFSGTGKSFWHIDHMTQSPDCEVSAAVLVLDSTPRECMVNSHLKRAVGLRRMVDGFGSSDCKEGCGGHLLSIPSRTSLQAIRLLTKIYRELGFRPLVIPCKGYKGYLECL
ncbi:MAG: hypothetical protein CMO12_04410 [Thaumarchaeota archaeon]|jgi:Uri superfamily endonuclease|nr:hypothetical protein [Nitrososphaerota archaeon]